MSDHSDLVSDIESDYKQPQPMNAQILSQDKKKAYEALVKQKVSWGKNQEKYHKDYQSSQEGSEDEVAEEIEADNLQKQNMMKIQEDDYFDEFQDNTTQQPLDYENISSILNIDPKEIIRMNPEDLKDKINSEWPELQEMLNQIEKTQSFLRKSINAKTKPNVNQAFYQELHIKHRAAYLILLMFYLQLRFKTQLTKNHPIFKSIVDCKQTDLSLKEIKPHIQLLDENRRLMKQSKSIKKAKLRKIAKSKQIDATQPVVYETKSKRLQNVKKQEFANIMNDLDKNDQHILNPSKNANLDISQESSIININKKTDIYDSGDELFNDDAQLEFYADNIDQQQQTKQKKRKEKQDEKVQDFEKINQFFKLKKVKVNEPRKINFVMLKKKSLMQRRRGKRETNSRVKHKEKFSKALQKLKTQGKTHKIQKTRAYEGENGVKANIIRSKKLN